MYLSLFQWGGKKCLFYCVPSKSKHLNRNRRAYVEPVATIIDVFSALKESAALFLELKTKTNDALD